MVLSKCCHNGPVPECTSGISNSNIDVLILCSRVELVLVTGALLEMKNG